MSSQPNNHVDKLNEILERCSVGVGGMVSINGEWKDGIEVDEARRLLDKYYADFYRDKYTPTYIMGRTLEEVCEILTMLDMERLAEMQLTIRNLKKWQKLLAEEQKKTFEKTFERLTAQFNSKGNDNDK